MPNRKTFDEHEKVDHSGHSTQRRERGDLAPTPDSEPEEGQVPAEPTEEGTSPGSQEHRPGHGGQKG
jgi:hypothetical protein